MEGLHNLPNLSFNCQFTFTPGFKFTNTHHVARDAKLTAEPKVYLSLRAVRQHRHRRVDQARPRQAALRLAGHDELDQVLPRRPRVFPRERHAQRLLHRRPLRPGLHVSQPHPRRPVPRSDEGGPRAHGGPRRAHPGDHGQLRRRRQRGQRRPHQGDRGPLLRRLPRRDRLHQRLRPGPHPRPARHPADALLRLLHRSLAARAPRWPPT
jgi:hypothetical protein